MSPDESMSTRASGRESSISAAPNTATAALTFYRGHYPTGDGGRGSKDDRGVNALGYASSSAMSHQILERDGGDRSKWNIR